MMRPRGRGLTSLKQTKTIKEFTMEKILTLLENDATLTADELSVMLKKEVGEVKNLNNAL